MKNLSIRFKITLWFSVILTVIVALSYIIVFYVSESIMKKTIRDTLISTVANNIDEVEYYDTLSGVQSDNDADQYIEYKNGYLEIDDDYLDLVNGVFTSLYLEDGTLLYGENPIAKNTASYSLSDGRVQELTVNGVDYFIYDSKLIQDGLDGLWLRGVVSEEQGTMHLTSIVRLSLYALPFLLALAVFGGYFIAWRMLSPIRDIEKAASCIGKGQDLKKRIDIAPGTDELHRLVATFNEMFERLDEAFETERQFSSDVSHELRTPMAVIMAQCEFSLEKEKTPEEYKAALQMIQRQGGKMSRLIDDLLRFVRLEQKSDSFKKERVDLSLLVASACDEASSWRERNIVLSCEAEPELYINGNRELLRRMLSNLIENAFRYGKDNGFIAVTLKGEKDKAVLSVRDNGIGISPEHQEKIFNRFYQVDASRAGKGVGLGLSMVQEIVRFHEGTIAVESEPDKGSNFILTFNTETDL